MSSVLPRLATRATFIDVNIDDKFSANSEYWTLSKSGNLYVRDHGHTYTVVREYDHDEHVVKYRGVVVGPGGRRKDVGPYEFQRQLWEALWPAGSAAPISA